MTFPSSLRLLGCFLAHGLVVLLWLNVSVIGGAALMALCVWPSVGPRWYRGELSSAAMGAAVGAGLWAFAILVAVSLGPVVRFVLRFFPSVKSASPARSSSSH